MLLLYNLSNTDVLLMLFAVGSCSSDEEFWGEILPSFSRSLEGEPVDRVALLFIPAAKFFIEFVRLLSLSNTSFLDKQFSPCFVDEKDGLEDELKQLLFIVKETPFEIDDFRRLLLLSFSDLAGLDELELDKPDGGSDCC